MAKWGDNLGGPLRPGTVFSTQAFDASAPLRKLVIDIAASQIGVVEHPRGSNRGPEVDEYISTTGLDPTEDSYPWCVCFCIGFSNRPAN